MALKEFLQHSKEFRGVLGKADKQACKHLKGIQSEHCPVGACLGHMCIEQQFLSKDVDLELYQKAMQLMLIVCYLHCLLNLNLIHIFIHILLKYE